MEKGKFIIEYIIGMLIGFVFGIIITMTLVSDKIETLENQVVEAYDKGYSDGENHALIVLMEDYFDLEVENAILKERIKWLEKPSDEEAYEQIVDDFELTLELMQHYYENNITSHSFGDWLQINYPALYERLLNYY